MPTTYRHGIYRHPSFFIWYGIALHLFWAAMLLFGTGSQNISPLAETSRYFGTNGLALTFICVAVLAGWALWTGAPRLWQTAALLPQQVALLISAGSALHIAFSGQTASGTRYPVTFLLSAQAPVLFAALFHTLALSNLWRRPR